MKRCIAYVCVAVMLLAALAGCGTPDTPAPQEEQKPTAVAKTYTALPTELTITALGTLPQNASPAEGGLYYTISKKFGIMTFDGSYDSGAMYDVCRPLGNAFLVSKSMGLESDPLSFNSAGVVDAKGNVLVPLQYASVVAVDSRFVRVAEITGTCETKEESITDFKNSLGDTVYCKGNWYLYDLQTGKKVPGATGTKKYASYSYSGKYIKYVTDDKVQHITTPEGAALPENAVHLMNGYYKIEAENTVYDAYGNKKFTYDPNGYIPCNDQNVSDYIIAKKTVDGRDRYVVMDLTGTVISGELDVDPIIRGNLLLVNNKVCNFKGEVLLDATVNSMYMDPITKQAWMATDVNTKEKFLLDKDGKILHRSGKEETTFNVNNYDMHRKDGENDPFHLILKDGSYTLKGVSLAPWLVRTTNADGTYNLVETISGKTLLSNCKGLAAAVGGDSILYVYTVNADGTVQVYYVS